MNSFRVACYFAKILAAFLLGVVLAPVVCVGFPFALAYVATEDGVDGFYKEPKRED